jgi:hypothetical protein
MTRTNDYQPRFDVLESRELMAASLTASFANGLLKIEGTEKADVIKVRESNGIAGTFISVDNCKISVNGKLQGSVNAFSVNKIEVRA